MNGHRKVYYDTFEVSISVKLHSDIPYNNDLQLKHQFSDLASEDNS